MYKRQALQTGSWSEVANYISKCDELLDATLNEDADKVAELVEIAHETYTSAVSYTHLDVYKRQ